MINSLILRMIEESGEIPENMKRTFKKGTRFYRARDFYESDDLVAFVEENNGKRLGSLGMRDLILPVRVDTLTVIISKNHARTFIGIPCDLLIPGRGDIYVASAEIVVAADKTNSVPLLPISEYERKLKDMNRKIPARELMRIGFYSL